MEERSTALMHMGSTLCLVDGETSPVNSREKPNNLRILARPPYIHDRLAPAPTHSKIEPMRFTPQFLEELRARLPVSEVVGRRVKLKRAGKE